MDDFFVAIPEPGYQFSHWKIVDGEDHRMEQSHVTWTLDGDIYVEAILG